MPRKIVVLRDKYGSTTRYYPKVLKQCLPIELQDMLPTTKGNFTGKIYFDEWDANALAPVIEIKKDATHKAELRVWGNNVQNNDIYGVEMQYQEGNDLATVSIDKDGILLSGINKDINIVTVGTGKLYINGVEYQAGGGSQLYQHNVRMHTSNLAITITITNTDNTSFTKSSINTWLSDKGFIGASPNYDTYNLGFVYSINNDKLVSQGIAFRSGTTFSYKNIVGSWVGIIDSDITFDLDTVIPL